MLSLLEIALVLDARGIAGSEDGKAARLRTGADLGGRAEHEIVDVPVRIRPVVELARNAHRSEAAACGRRRLGLRVVPVADPVRGHASECAPYVELLGVREAVGPDLP